ncbi:hypothetical protein GW915_05165 [bacterium]|nr:hypothetical protein [bacterium]
MIKMLFAALWIVPSLASEFRFQILHTNDLHSHFEGSWVAKPEGGVQRMGGYASLISEITKFKASALARGEQTLTLDAGDFFSGTIFHVIAPNPSVPDFPEWAFFQKAGYDAVTLGNHEFDPLNRGVKTMFKKMQGGPALVSANILLPENSPLKGKVHPFIVKELHFNSQKLRVAILGLLGPDACTVSRGTRENIHFVGFDDKNSKENWRELLTLIQQQILAAKKLADIVVLVMHAGQPEDDQFASALNGVDLIIAGHTHEVYSKKVDGIPIAQAGQYGAYLGKLNLIFNLKTKKLRILNEVADRAHPIFPNVSHDRAFERAISQYKSLSHKILGPKLPPADKIIFVPDRDYIKAGRVSIDLAVLATSRIRDGIEKAGGPKVDAYFTSSGLLRSSFHRGVPVTFADVFEMFSVGFDAQGNAGSEVVVFQLQPKDFKRLIEFMEIYSHFSRTFHPAFSDSVSFRVRKWGIPFVNRIADLKLHGKSIDDLNTPIILASNSFVTKNFDFVEKKTLGLIKLRPLDMQGNPAAIRDSGLPKEFELFSLSFLQN